MSAQYKNFLLAFSVSISMLACNSQEKKDNKAMMDDLLKRELANQENAKSGNQNPQIQIITDLVKVEKLRKDITRKITAQEIARAKDAAENKSLWQRYKQNDKSVVLPMLKILRGNNIGGKSEIYDGLEKDYDDPETYAITETELVEQILKGIENPLEEEDAVQLVGLNKITGYQDRFEKRLLSGQSTEEGRIFFWLGGEAKNIRVLDYIEARIKTKKLPGEELDEIISGLEKFGEKGNAEIKKKVGELALFIYQNKLIPRERIEELKNSAFTSDAAETLLICLFKYGDKNIIPIAYDILNRKIRITGPVTALIRLEGTRHLDRVYAYLKNEDDFYKGLDIIETMDKKLIEDDLLKEVLIQFAKQKDIADYSVERIVRSFQELKEGYILNTANLIHDKKLADRIKKAYDLSKISFDEVLNDLLSLNLIEKRPEASVISKLAKEADGNPGAFIYGILEHENLFQYFDAETGFVPADYDKLLLEFAGKSKGILKDMIVWMDAKENKDGETFSYTITVISNDKAFITKPEDIGDWYDVMTVNAILDKVLTDLKSSEKFVPIETGDQTAQYIFGNPEKINLLVSKFNL